MCYITVKGMIIAYVFWTEKCFLPKKTKLNAPFFSTDGAGGGVDSSSGKDAVAGEFG